MLTYTRLFLALVGLVLTNAHQEEESNCIDPENYNCQEHLNNSPKEADSSSSGDGILLELGDGAPSLQDLTEMFNDLNTGKAPEYIKKRGFTVYNNGTADYTYSNGNTGFVNFLTYGLFQDEGQIGTYYSMAFNFIKGDYRSFHYDVGTGLFSRVRYYKEDTFVTWRASTEGVFLYKIPSGMYSSYGNYESGTQGMAHFNGKTMLASQNTIGMMNTSYYSSRTVANTNSNANHQSYSTTIDMFSLTDGQTATINMYGKIPEEGNLFNGTTEGTLHNSSTEATLESRSSGFCDIDRTNPLGKANLKGLFNGMYMSVGLYLPA